MQTEEKNYKIIGQWLLLGVFMLIVQIALGGITRLTGSGLSITEWKLVLGALPPMDETEWQVAFEKYQQIGQFKFINADFTLDDFKFIYFWEWLHRNWGRLIGIIFALPFVYFLIKKMVPKSFIPKLLILFLLGLSQGLIGWIMVASGINDTNLYVDHFKLALHFCSALFLISLTFWYALEYIYPNGLEIKIQPNSKKILLIMISLLSLQLCYGAFMAGLKAAQSAPTWPSINGDWIPDILGKESLWSHPILVHFIHRNLAYVLFFTVIFWSFKVKRSKHFRYKFLPITLVFIQLILGIYAVLCSPRAIKNGWGSFEWNAQLHQFVAMLLLLSLVFHLFQVKKVRKPTKSVDSTSNM